jgi:hypothetical protein
MTIHDKIAAAVKPFVGKTLNTKQVQALLLEKYPGTNPTSVIPSDHSGPNPRSGRSYCPCSGQPSQVFAHDNGCYRVLDATGTARAGGASISSTSTAGKLTVKTGGVATTWKTITLERAKSAVKAYNEGVYGCLKNPDLDRQARDMFADGLGSSCSKIERQVEFIGRDYGGAAGFKAAFVLAPDIARDIFANRDRYVQAARSALPILTKVPSRDTIEILYDPFVKPLHGKSNWQVWGTKFWHFLNPDAFPIEDSRVDTFFALTDLNSVDKYLKFLNRFRGFVLAHQSWLPELRQVDGGDAWSDTKLWDKMCYGLVDLNSPPARR